MPEGSQDVPQPANQTAEKKHAPFWDKSREERISRIRYLRDSVEPVRKGVIEDADANKEDPKYYRWIHRWFRRSLKDREKQFKDELTDLASKTGFEERLTQHAKDFRRREYEAEKNGTEKPKKGVVGFIDINGMKEINDSQGHEGGNQFLIKVARALERASRESDTIARFHGDEFGVFLPEADMEKDLDAWIGKVQKVLDEEGITGAFGFANFNPNNPLGAMGRADNTEAVSKAVGKRDQILSGTARRGSTFLTEKQAAQALREDPQILNYNKGR